MQYTRREGANGNSDWEIFHVDARNENKQTVNCCCLELTNEAQAWLKAVPAALLRKEYYI
eukprot:scaffold311001_cov39-Prasinocladus_malaysianus.AAC.1